MSEKTTRANLWARDFTIITAGSLTIFINERMVLMGSMLLCALAAVIFIGGGREHVSRIYNMTEGIPEPENN